MGWGIKVFRWVIAVLLIGGSGYAVARHLQDGNTAGHYRSVEVLRPKGTPKAMVVLLPDSGHAQDGQRLAEMLSGDPVAGRASPAMHLRRLGKDTLCPESRARGVQVVTRPGGHHFDHDPVALAGLLIQGWQQAAQTPSHG